MCTLNERHGYTPVFLTWLYLSMQEERRGPRSAQKTAGGAGVGVEEKKTPRGSESCASTDIHQGSYVVNDLTVYYFPLRQELFIFLRVEKKLWGASWSLSCIVSQQRADRYKKRKQIFKRAEDYVKEYRRKERDEIRLMRQAKNRGNYYIPGKARLAFVTRIRG